MNGGPSRRIALRRSAALYLATALFIAFAVAAVGMTVGPRFGVGHAVVAAAVVFAILVAAAARHARNQPVALKIGPEGLSVWNRAGILRAQGSIVGCSQWSDSLLMLWLEEDGGKLHRLLIFADMAGRGAFRELAVLARRGAHV
jgi:hypothetical protein